MANADWISLGDLLDSSGPPAAEQMVLVARWVTVALADGHRQGAIHGGLSPQTVGLDVGEDGFPTGATIRPPAEGSSGLASAYAAPEVRAGAAPTGAADVYSCGAVLRHCLSPQSADNPAASPMRATGPLADTLRAMMAQRPEERPTAAEAAALLGPDHQERAEVLAPGEEKKSPRRWVVVLAAAVLLLGLSTLGSVIWHITQGEPTRTSSAAGAGTTEPEEGPSAGEGDLGSDDSSGGDTTLQTDGTTATGTTDTDTDPVTAEQTTTDAGTTEQDGEARPIALPPAVELCEDGLDEPYPKVWAGNEVTSCPFSVNVREAYVDQGATGADVEVVADSPVTGRTYTMSCEDTAPVRCRGGNSAIVYFGDD